MKTRETAIDSLIRATRGRAVRESIAALLIIFWYAHDLHASVVYSPGYFGSLIIIAAAGFIMGMLWCHTLTYDTLATHPASDAAFWRAAFESQARLLSNVPVWYVAPIFIGATLRAVPTSPGHFGGFVRDVLFFVAVSGLIVWLNRAVASRLRAEAREQFAEACA